MRDDKQLTLQVTIQEYPATNKVSVKKQKPESVLRFFIIRYQLLINELFAQGDIFLQRIQIPSSAFCSNALRVPIDLRSSRRFYPAAAVERRNVRTDRRLNVGTFDNALFALQCANQRQPKRAAAWPIDRVADPPPAFAQPPQYPRSGYVWSDQPLPARKTNARNL